MYAVPRVLILLAFCLPLSAQEPESRENTATLEVQNVVVQEGTPTIEVPITISSDHEGQTISGLHMTVAVGDPQRLQALIVNAEDPSAFKSSLWNTHPRTIQVAMRMGTGVASFQQITWFEPVEQINVPCDGVVATLVIDTSKMAVGEYPVVTNWNGFTSASVVTSVEGDSLGYHPIRLEHDPGVITIVPRRGGNLNQ